MVGVGNITLTILNYLELELNQSYYASYRPASNKNQEVKEASPILIGGRQAAVEIKRTTTRVGSGRGRFPSGRGAGFRNDSFRGRGTFGGGRSYGRNEFANRGDFSGRGRGPGGRTGEGYQQGRGRGGRRGGPYQNAV